MLQSLLGELAHFLLLFVEEILELLQMVDEDSSSLKCSFLNNEFGFRELLENSLEDFLGDAKEKCSILLCGLLRIIFFSSNFNNEVGSEIEH